MATGYSYGNLVDDQTRRRLNDEAAQAISGGIRRLGDEFGQSMDRGVRRMSGDLRPVFSNNYGVGATPRPNHSPVDNPDYSIRPGPPRVPQKNPLAFLGYPVPNQSASIGTQLGINDIGRLGKVPPRGGYVGAATDAQASQAMRDRADQSAASQQIIAGLNTGASAERDTRAARLGIDRQTLDAMEGRGQPAVMPVTAQTPAFDPFSRPGDSFQDTRGRAALYDQTLRDAQGLPSRRQVGAIQASQWLLAPGALQGQFAQQQGQQQAGMLRGLLDAQNAAATRAFEQQKFASDQAMAQQRLGLDQNRYLLDERKAQLEAVRNGELDRAAIEQKRQISPNDIRAKLMRRYLQQDGVESQKAFDALQKLFPPSNPLSTLLATPPQ